MLKRVRFSALGINPLFVALTALWFGSYGFVIARLMRRAEPICFWFFLIVLLPAGQFIALLYFSRDKKEA